MEPQVKDYNFEKPEYKCGKKRNCFEFITVILLTAFAVVIGLIIGAAVSAAILAALPAVIVLAVVLGLLLILSIILMICNKNYKKKQNYHY